MQVITRMTTRKATKDKTSILLQEVTTCATVQVYNPNKFIYDSDRTNKKFRVPKVKSQHAEFI